LAKPDVSFENNFPLLFSQAPRVKMVRMVLLDNLDNLVNTVQMAKMGKLALLALLVPEELPALVERPVKQEQVKKLIGNL
jgi:hypothetical protein